MDRSRLLGVASIGSCGTAQPCTSIATSSTCKYPIAPAWIGFLSSDALGAEYANDLFVGASRTTLHGGYLLRFDLSSDRTEIASTDARLADRLADNAAKCDVTESESCVLAPASA